MITIQVKPDRFQMRLVEDMNKKYPAAVVRSLRKLMIAAAIEVESNAKELIAKGPTRTGRAYRRPGGKIHIASAPGEPAKSDRGDLVTSIMHVEGPKRVTVGSVVKHGAYMELGTKKVAARPWLIPSLEAARPSIEKRLEAIMEDL